MIDLYYWPTPNGDKITIFLEETGLEYKLIPINIRKGEQFDPAFLNISPNNKIPAILDHQPIGSSKPISLFESGAILLYLADKVKKFISEHVHERNEVIQWLFWQMANLGPMAGQNHHFTQYAPEIVPYAINRYVKETSRLYAILDQRLADREFIAIHYSIADMACYPWIVLHEKQGINLEDFPNIKKWLDTMHARPAVQRAFAIANEIKTESNMTDDARKILFGQDEQTVKNRNLLKENK